ncbi:hypothetical protein [Roseinatronobacter sp.]
MRRSEPLSMRQARVGIVANPATIRLPVHPPRDVWTRWPDMRSRRRHHGARPVDAAQNFGDPVLDGVLLGDFARALRAGDCGEPDGGGVFGPRLAQFAHKGWHVATVLALLCGAAALGLVMLR